jgi:hypothetical protein
MTADLDLVHRALRYSHVAAGAVGLLLFWIPVFAKKGGRLHVRTGRAFAWCAGYVGLTGLASSAWALLDTAGFGGAAFARLPEQSAPYYLEAARFLFAILGYLSLSVLSGLWFGLRVVWTRQRHESLREPLLLGLQAATGLASACLAAFGGWNLVAGFRGEHLLPAAEIGKYWVPLVLGVIGLLSVKEDIGYVLRARPSRMAWWYKHMENMLGVGIAFHTAFLVFGANRLFGLRLPGPWALLPWVLPTAVGVPAIVLWVRAYRRRFGELATTGPAPAPDQPFGEEDASVMSRAERPRVQ